jgi:hypothetical protein
MTTETAPRRPLFPATAAVWRFVTRPFRWLWRRKLKISLWLATLITLGWQYENWHGRRAYQEQLALFHAEYGDMKWSDFAPPRIPDDENFFAAPVFETFVVKEPRARPPRRDGQTEEQYEYYRKADALADALPHGRFLRMKLPEIKTVPSGQVPELPPQEGIAFLDLPQWVEEETKAGRQLPGGQTPAQWLRASLPEDATVNGFLAALSRKQAGVLPHRSDVRAIGEQLNDPAVIPIPAVSGLFGNSKVIGLRARAAARAGDGDAARQHCEVLWLLAEGYSSSGTLVGTLVGLALTGVANTATTEALACRCWTEADLVILRDRLLRVDEERTTFTGLLLEGFGWHFWPGDIKEWHRKAMAEMPAFRIKTEGLYLWTCAHGPDGWIDANLAHHLRWWRTLMMPDGPGDDLQALHHKLSANMESVMKDTHSGFIAGIPSPRKVWAAISIPAMSGIASSALQHQTRRRQLLLAIAIERHFLAKGTLPQKAEDLVPAFLDAIPGDPHAPGTPLRWEAGTGSIRYRILSAQKDAALGFPEQVP